MTTQFQAGQTYKNNRVTITVTRRTEKSIWFEDFEGNQTRRKVQVTGNKFEGLYEFISVDEFYNIDARFIVETTETASEPNQDTVSEPLETTLEPTQDVAESITEPLTMTVTERRAMIDSFNYHASLLHSTDEDSPKWDQIWDKMESIKNDIDNAVVCDEDPNKAIVAEIKTLKSRLNKSLIALTNEDRVGSPAWENHFHNINSLRDDIERLNESRV